MIISLNAGAMLPSMDEKAIENSVMISLEIKSLNILGNKQFSKIYLIIFETNYSTVGDET